jgi:hypothetical protein
LPEVIVVKLVIAKSSKWRCVDVRAFAYPAHSVTSSAQRFEQGSSALLLAIEGVTDAAPGAYHQKSEASFVHGHSL